MSMRHRSSQRITPDEFFEDSGGANGIPAWENPAAMTTPDPMPKQLARRMPPRAMKKPPPISSRVATDSAVSDDMMNDNASRESFENMVIECDYSDMSSNLSVDDAATFADDGSRSCRGGSKRSSTKHRCPQPPRVPDRGYGRNDAENFDTRHHHRPNPSSTADIEEEERKLIELAMERSLQESSSLMSVSYRSNERSSPTATSSASSLIGMNGCQYNDMNDSASNKSAWKRDGKKWARTPSRESSTDSLKPIEEARGGGNMASPYLNPPSTREERMALAEQEMITQALENSMHGIAQDMEPVPRHSVRRRQSHSQVNDDYDFEELAALERLEELERERLRIEQAMSRRGGSRVSQRNRSGDHGMGLRGSSSRSVQRHPSGDPHDTRRHVIGPQGSYREQLCNDDDYSRASSHRDPYNMSPQHTSPRRSFRETGSPMGDPYRDGGHDRRELRAPVRQVSYNVESPPNRPPRGGMDRRQQYRENHEASQELSLQNLSFRNIQQMEYYDRSSSNIQQQERPHQRRPPGRSRSNESHVMSYGSDEANHRFSQSYRGDDGPSHGGRGYRDGGPGPDGRRYVWKRGPNKAWGRFPEDDGDDDEEEEDAIVADVLRRSMHEK